MRFVRAECRRDANRPIIVRVIDFLTEQYARRASRADAEFRSHPLQTALSSEALRCDGRCERNVTRNELPSKAPSGDLSASAPSVHRSRSYHSNSFISDKSQAMRSPSRLRSVAHQRTARRQSAVAMCASSVSFPLARRSPK